MASEINFLLLVELIVVVIVASAFLFYWNRLLGSCLAFFIRLYTWHSQSAYISIGSLQISPLAGRISFRDVEYHSSNLSFRALHGHVTWRYWKLRVRQEADSQSNNSKRNRLPCRINVYAEGVECFVFNRTPAYDAIVERMKKHEKEDEDAGARTSDETLAKQKSNGTNATGNGEDGVGFGARLRKVAKSATSGTSQTQDTASSSDSHQKPGTDPHALPLQPKPVKTPAAPGVNWFREALPVELHIVTGSLVLGSDASPSLLIGNFERTDGTLEITDSRSACDDYKLLVNLNFEQATVLLRTNVDYSGPLLAHGKKVYDELLKREREIAKQPPSKLSSFLGFHALSKRFAFMHNPKFSSPPVAGMPADRVWKGLARYRVDPDNTSKPAWREEREYAKRTELITASSLQITYYADTPGLVPSPEEAEIVDESDEFGNVESPPEYGIDIVVHSGKINYGPWADRQRDALQKTFAPSIFFDSEPKPRLQVGDQRIHSNMTVNVQLVDKTSLRIPTREPSKDWEHENKPQDAERRYGWLDVVVGENSSINYTQSQFATGRGYDAILVLHLDSLVISSSVNYLDFLQAQTCKLSMTMPTPLSWNARRDWGLDLTLDSPKISLLRDHVTLISDLAKDWSSGQLGDFHHFVPNHYNFRVTLLKYDFQLCVNDFNIIDHPGHRDANALMDIAGPRMEAYVAVGATQYRPEFTTIPFSVNVDDAVVRMSVPKWDTHRSFADDVNFEVGKIGHVSAKGTYTYYSTPHPDHQEMLVLHLEGKRVAFKALGWVLRRMFCTKDNYFGAFTNFATSPEFLEKFDHDPEGVGDKVEEKYRPGRSDALNVQVTMNVEESLILLSEQVHGCVRGLAMPVPQLQMALKSVEHFMELSLDALPTYIVATEDMDDTYRLGIAPPIIAKEAVFIEGIELKANRLFGPQPYATTYLCLWEFTAPRITAFLSAEFVSLIQASVAAVIYNFTDLENAPASFYIPKTPPDVTFFKLGIDEFAATLFTGNTAVSLSMPDGVNLDTSSWATRSFSSAVGLVIPVIKVHLLEQETYRRKWVSIASIDTALALDVFSAPSGWRKKASEQQKFLKREDGPTKRIWYMYQKSGDESDGNHHNMLYLPRPRPRAPETVEESSTVSTEKESIFVRETSSAHSSSAHTSEEESDAEFTGRIPLRRRSRSFATARETMRSSMVGIGDESDSVSDSTASSGNTSSGDGKSGAGYDMAGALAERLTMFRSAHEQVVPTFPAWTDDNDRDGDSKPMPKPNKALGDGAIIRVVCKKLDVELGSRSVKPVMTLVNAMRSVPVSPEIRLDQLVTHHTDKVMADVSKSDSKLIDLSLPEVRFKINTSIGEQRNDVIDVHLRNVYGSILTVPEHDLGPASTDIIFGSQSALITSSTTSLTSGQMSLSDAADNMLPRSSLLPVIQARIDNIQVGFTGSTDQQVRAKVAMVDVQMVTAAAACLIDVSQSWEAELAKLPPKGPSPISPARLVYDIVQKALASDIGATSPSFRFEGGYELHAEDQRSIRRDPGWIMLARLRHWTRQMELDDDAVRHIDVSDEDMATYIISELARVEEAFCQDESLVVFQPFIKDILGHTAAVPDAADERDERKSKSYFVNLGDFAIQHRERSVESSAITTSVFGLRGATAGVQKSHGVQDEQVFERLRLLVAVKEIYSELQDGLLPAIETLLKLATDKTTPKPASGPPDASARRADTDGEADAMVSKLLVIDVQLQDISLSVVAGGLRLRLAVRNAQQAVARRQKYPHIAQDGQTADEVEAREQKLTHDSVFLCFEGINLALLQPQDDDDEVINSPDRIVALFKVEHVRSTIDLHTLGEYQRPSTVKVIFGVESMEFDSRPQLRAFLAFARDWQKRHLGNYRPIINDIRALIAKDRQKYETLCIAPERPGGGDTSAEPDVTLDLSIGRIQLQVRAAKAVWLRWDVGKLSISRRGCTSNVEFGVRIAPQVVGAYTSMKKVKGRDASSIKLPSLTAIGSHRRTDGKPHISAAVTLGFFVGVLKPAVLDRLLSLHQRLGTDILHIVQEYRETVRKELAERHAKYTSTSSVLSDTADKQLGEDSHQTATQSASAGLGVFVDLQVSVAGVRFGLRADDVATTLLFEALSLRAQVTNTDTEQAALLWRAKVDHFGLSLGHLGSAQITDDAEPIRKHRSAYMVLDIDVQEIPSHQNVASQLNVSLNRVHTVMHVAALSELSDLVRSWQSDIHTLRDNRASEVAEVKETTTKILKKLDASDKNATLEESWFASRLFTVNVVGFGIAVPLDEGAAIDLQHRENTAVPAMLFSTRVVSFQNRRNETARFKIQQMALQFLEKFDQGAPEHFTGDYHPSTNRMLLPSLDCEAQMSSVPEMWSLSAHVSATDFKLSLAPDVVDGVFKLIDLYDAGKDRLAELERQYRVEMAKREALDSVHAKYDDKPTPSPARKHQQIVVRMSYTFNSGIVELHRSVDSANVQFVNPFAGGPATGGGTPRTRCWHDTFVLPTISLWMDYAGPTAGTDGGDEASVGTLVFNSAVHESRNTLRPTMLPFFVDLVNRVERRHQRKPRESSFAAAERKAEIVAATVSESTLQAIAPTPGSTIRLRVTLRIDRSELRLSCAPDSNAYVDLKWESGGFMASCAMGGSDEPSTVAGSISGVTASLSHEFAEKGRSCIEAGAKDLAFSVAHEGGEKGISVVLDTQLSGQFRLDAFSAWLIFTSVWIDNAPRLDVPLRAAIPEATSSSNIAATAAAVQPTPTERFEEQRPKMGVAAIVRFRTIDFDADVAVTHAKLEITPIVLRTISNGEKTDVNLSIGTTKVTAKGDISGNLCSDKLVFNTLRRSSRASEEAQATVLSMSIDAGDLRGNLFLGEINILRFHLEPAVVTLADDWASFSEGSDSHVSLAFGVKAGQFRGVIRLLAIPRLLGNLYSVLDMVDSQQRIATQRSETFKVTQQRKTDEPSPVAAVILHKARRVSAAAGSTAHVRTAQTMRFDLAGIDVGVFNEDYEAGGGGQVADFYRFVVGKVEADLKRSVKDGGVDDQGAVQEIPVRQLGLLVSLVQWDTSDGAKVAAKEKREMAPSELIEMAWKTGHKGIASLPSMTMNMASQELSQPSVLDFDFDLVWGETDGDIGILPNFFEQAVQAFKKLVKGIDEQQLARARRTERLDSKASSEKSRRSSVKEDAKDKPRVPERGTSLEYRPRDPMWADDPPIPKLKQLGESTGEAARFIPRIKSATKELPVLSHRFVTLPLEEGMDLLLKLYEKQLPERV